MSSLYFPQTQEQRMAIADWAAKQIPWLQNGGAFGQCEAWAILSDDGNIAGALVFNNYRPEIGDIELNVITMREGWASRDIFVKIADYVFNVLKCSRMSCTLPKGAKKHRAHAMKVGFQHEGVRRKGFYNGVDAILYGMLRSECKYLEQREAA